MSFSVSSCFRFKVNQSVNGGFYILVHVEDCVRVQQIFVSPLVAKLVKRNRFFLPHAPNKEFVLYFRGERSYTSDFVEAGLCSALPCTKVLIREVRPPILPATFPKKSG